MRKARGTPRGRVFAASFLLMGMYSTSQNVLCQGESLADPRSKNWIREVRESLGLSQPAFAAKLGHSIAAVAKWEAGDREPRARIKLKIIEMAPPEIQAALGLRQRVLPGKASGLIERIEALETAMGEQAKAIRALQLQVKGGKKTA